MSARGIWRSRCCAHSLRATPSAQDLVSSPAWLTLELIGAFTSSARTLTHAHTAARALRYAGCLTPMRLGAQAAPRTLVAVLAHADDEDPACPILARYARERVQIYLLIATDGSRGTGFAAVRGDTVTAGQDLARRRASEAACATKALGVKPPILLSFPDGSLGDYAADRSLAYRLTQQIAEELERLRPDVILTWGPEGGMGHPDHRMISSIVTQLQRANAPASPIASSTCICRPRQCGPGTRNEASRRCSFRTLDT